MTGIDELFSQDGKLERPVAEGLIDVPDVRLDGDWLVWEWQGPRKRYRPADGLLEEFLELATAPTAGIYKFARRYGVLEICRHDLPSTHNPQPPAGVVWPIRMDDDRACHAPASRRWNGQPFKDFQELHAAPIEQREHVSAWRAFAREAAGILRVASALHAERETTASDWQDVFDRDPFIRATGQGQPIPWWPINIKRYRALWCGDHMRLASKVNDWVVMANLRPMLEWSPGPPRVVFKAANARDGRTTLFSALALQVLLTVSGAKGLAICSGCQSPFSPARRPRKNQRSYCDECREKGVPFRDAKRDERARK